MYKWITYKGSNICYYIFGKGLPVVLLHGFGENAGVWMGQIKAFESYQLIMPDLPGSGYSGMIDDMSMEGLAAAVYAILKQEEIEHCIMIGHSMGGYITLAFADQYKNMLWGFGLFHSTAYADTEEKKATRKKGIELMKEFGAYPFLKTIIPNLYSRETAEKTPEVIDEHLKSAQTAETTALIAYYQAMISRKDRRHLLKESSVPVLFVFGKEDKVVPLQDGLQQCYLPNLSYIHILTTSGHMGMQEEAKQTNVLLNHFLSDTLKPHQKQ